MLSGYGTLSESSGQDELTEFTSAGRRGRESIDAQMLAVNELLERYGFDTTTGDSKHRRSAILWVSGLPMPFEGKQELTEFILSERFLDV